MREFTAAIGLSVIVLGGALLLPCSIDKSPLPQTIAVQQAQPQTKAPRVELEGRLAAVLQGGLS
jgi:hypothetical protein